MGGRLGRQPVAQPLAQAAMRASASVSRSLVSVAIAAAMDTAENQNEPVTKMLDAASRAVAAVTAASA